MLYIRMEQMEEKTKQLRSRFGEILVKQEVINPDQLKTAIEEQKRTGKRLGDTLVRLGYISQYELVAFLSKQYGVPAINLDEFDVMPEVLKFIPRESAVKHSLIPINRSGGTLVVAMSDPSNIFAIDELKFATGHNIEVVVASEDSIKNAIERHYGDRKNERAKIHIEETGGSIDEIMGEIEYFIAELGKTEEMEVDDLARASEEAPVIRLVNHILVNAIRHGASDIHIEPYEKDYRVRYRIDGILYDTMRPPFKIKNAISSRVKIMSNLDIAERRLPQDGRIKLRLGQRGAMEYRVSVIPTIFGEKVVLRLLDQSSLQLDLTKLGFEEEQLTAFKDCIYKPYGMVLLTGPTGSGKTTTLYSSLIELNRTESNISTAEDPVEYSLQGINQVQIHEEIGLTFAACLRSFLRQDPDIILVGEIRDYETAEIGIKAALTGHLVLSTLHTNDAPSTITRLLNMGVEPFLVTASLNSVVAQRLVRLICARCREEVNISPQVLIDLGVSPKEVSEYKVYRGKGDGCKACLGTGYKGRLAVYEVMVLTDELKEFVLSGVSAIDLKREAVRQGMKTLRQSALFKLKHGITTIEEVVRNTASDN
ncbi:MAG: ral secretory pathway protein E/type pilus assembly ATPase PilB [Candidatus Dadabacteria bacterium]|jgi:type IV pilus assembly protein PilB|nr:ral secretory pathway protein E/type pilus assembly ATPase PilB [Candidatus Dadabacteria bacterium]